MPETIATGLERAAVERALSRRDAVPLLTPRAALVAEKETAGASGEIEKKQTAPGIACDGRDAGQFRDQGPAAVG